jgi:chorismate mutase
MIVPNNAVTRMPIKAQQREADMIAESIAELEQKLKSYRKEHRTRLAWIDAQCPELVAERNKKNQELCDAGTSHDESKCSRYH